MPEALLIADRHAGPGFWDSVGQHAAITQRMPPRLAVLVAEREQLDALRRLGGVQAVLDTAVPESYLSEMNDSEKLFVQAWNLRREPKKERVGDSLAWDTPGFEPPDRPKQ